MINPEYHKNGYAAEAAKRVIEFGFDKLAFNRIEAKFIVGNDASLAVMRKCNMKFEGVARSAMLIKGVYCDIGTCAILANEI